MTLKKIHSSISSFKRLSLLFIVLLVVGISIVFFYKKPVEAAKRTDNLTANARSSSESVISAKDIVNISIDGVSSVNQSAEEAILEPVSMADLEPTEEQSRLLYEAENIATARCMNEKGFEFEIDEYQTDSQLEPWFNKISAGDIEAASQFGYGIAESIGMDGIPMAPDANASYLNSLSSEEAAKWEEALLGPPHDPNKTVMEGAWVSVTIPGVGVVTWNRHSCAASARRALYEDDVKHAKNKAKAFLLREKIAIEIAKDSEYVYALNQWKNCMATYGLTFDHPQQAAAQLRQEYYSGKLDLEALQNREQQIATIDARCYNQAAVGEAHAAATQRAEGILRKEGQEQISQLAESAKRALVRAKQLVQNN